jgi:ADP-ribose pyrophosphatase
MVKTINSRIIHKGKNFNFLVDEVELSNGHIRQRDIVRHPGAVAIVPILDDGRVVLIRQYRYAPNRMLLEIPAGTLENGEPLIQCAVRELKEETGYEADKMEFFMSCYMVPGYSDEVIHFFLARGLTMVGDDPEVDENITLEIHSLDELHKMIKENIIEDAKTIIGILNIKK